MEQPSDIIRTISTLLDTEQYKEALRIPFQEHAQSFKDNYWDLIPVLIQKIDDETLVIKPSLQNSCESLLTLIAEKSPPEQALLEFIEQVELAKNDAQFIIILNCLQSLLKKLMIKKGRSLEWTVNCIITYVNSMPIPEYTLEGKERLLLDSDTNVRRIIKVYSALPQFYQPLLLEIYINNPLNKAIYKKQVIAAFLISLLGKPLIYIDLDPECNAQSEIRENCAILLQDLCNLERNVIKFFPYLEKLYQKDGKNDVLEYDDDSEISPYDQNESFSLTSLSSLFYMVLSDHFEIPDFSIPQVYSPLYIVNTAMYSVHHLLKFSEFSVINKGISLLKSLQAKLMFPVSHLLLSSLYFNVFSTLINIAVYCSYETIRKETVKLMAMFINKFNYKGRCFIVMHIFDNANHSGMMGYAITLFKNSIHEAFTSEDMLPECFSGQLFKKIIKKVCTLPEGAESDLAELADEIITVLNLLRYLTMRDKKNQTGIWDLLPSIENEYLSQLRTGLDLSKAHYQIQITDLEKGNKLAGEELLSVTVGKSAINKIPVEHKKQVLNSTLNAFHLIEGLLAHLCECINQNKELLKKYE